MCKIGGRSCEEIIHDFEPKILKAVSNVSYNDREDVKQEIRLKILEKMETINKLDAPGFFEFINARD